MLTDKILEIVQIKHDVTGGHCGVYIKTLQIELKISQEEIEEFIQELHNQNKIILCSGIHGIMIKLKRCFK